MTTEQNPDRAFMIIGCVTCDEFSLGQPKNGNAETIVKEMCNEHQGTATPIKGWIVRYGDHMGKHIHYVAQLPDDVTETIKASHTPDEQDTVPQALLSAILNSLNN